MRLQFGLDAFEHRAKSLSAQRIVNCYLEKTPINASNPVALVGSYGVEPQLTLASAGACRGAEVINGELYVVAGSALYHIGSNYLATNLGDVPGTTPVTIAGDGTHIAIAASGTLYIYDGDTRILAPVTDEDFPGCEGVVYLSTYFVIWIRGQLWLSESLEPGSWNALDFLTAEVSPDDIIGCIVEKGELIAGGRDTVQPFVVTDSEVPLDPALSGTAEVGLLAKHGFAKIANLVFFPAIDFTVRQMEGYTPTIISTPAISQAIEDLTAAEQEALQAFCFSESGHNFYALTSAHWTFVYDVSTQLWHQRKSTDLAYWRPIFAVHAYGKVWVGDRTAARVGTLDPHTYTEWGDPVTLIATCHAVDQDYRRTFAPALELVFDRGVGIPTGQGSDPQVMMRQSIDGGKTWGAERWRSMGKIGEYQTRAVWTRMGQARDRIIEFSISDPVRRALSYAQLIDIKVGAH